MPVAGLPSSSSMTNFTSRPASLYLCSSKKSSKPLIMSLPFAASGPVCGTSMPILIGPFWAHDGAPAAMLWATAATITNASSLRMSISLRESLKNFGIGQRPAERRRDQSQRETMHVLAVHGVDGLRRHDDPEVAIRGLEGGAQHARRRVDAGEDHRVGPESSPQNSLEVRRGEH